jgi:hypothetical protein
MPSSGMWRSVGVSEECVTSIFRLEEIKQVKGRLCGLVVRVLGYRSGGPGSIPGTNQKKNSASGTGSTQPREYN